MREVCQHYKGRVVCLLRWILEYFPANIILITIDIFFFLEGGLLVVQGP